MGHAQHRRRYQPLPVRFVSWAEVRERFAGKRVAVVGSGPGVLGNPVGFIDAHDIVVRVNNYKLSARAGQRCDVHYSFYGASVRPTVEQLQNDGVTLCMNKLPNENFIDSNWHINRNKLAGVDYKRVFKRRKDFWFCDTFIPQVPHLVRKMKLIDDRMPTTGFSCILDMLEMDCDIYLTGFDFFRTRIHNVDEAWKEGDADDPLGHVPEIELQWLRENYKNFRITFDESLSKCIGIKANSTPIT